MSDFWNSIRKSKEDLDRTSDGLGGSRAPKKDKKMDPGAFGRELRDTFNNDTTSFLKEVNDKALNGAMKLGHGRYNEWDPDTFNKRTALDQARMRSKYRIGTTPTEDLRERGGAYAGAIEESIGAPSAVGAIKAGKQGDYRAQMWANHQNEIADRGRAKERAKEEAKIRATNAFQTQRSDNDPASRYEYRF